MFDTDRERVAVALGAATQRMRAIVDSFALLVSIEHSRLRPALTAHPFASLVDRVVANVRPLAESKRMTIGVDPGSVEAAEVLADTGFFEMALSNVLANAVKYAPPGTPIAVRLDRRGGVVVVSVSDEGPGLAEHELDAVFERHVRGLARPTGNESSLGLGLYISRAICELMGGRIWAESRGPGKGSTFTMTLPEAIVEPVR
jgi:signal transduction histidine kinase